MQRSVSLDECNIINCGPGGHFVCRKSWRICRPCTWSTHMEICYRRLFEPVKRMRTCRNDMFLFFTDYMFVRRKHPYSTWLIFLGLYSECRGSQQEMKRWFYSLKVIRWQYRYILEALYHINDFLLQRKKRKHFNGVTVTCLWHCTSQSTISQMWPAQRSNQAFHTCYACRCCACKIHTVQTCGMLCDHNLRLHFLCQLCSTGCNNHLKSLLFQSLGVEHILKEQIDRWNFKTVQGQQLSKKQGKGKMYNALQISTQHFINCSLCGQRRDKVSFQALGAHKCLAPFEY